MARKDRTRDGAMQFSTGRSLDMSSVANPCVRAGSLSPDLHLDEKQSFQNQNHFISKAFHFLGIPLLLHGYSMLCSCYCSPTGNEAQHKENGLHQRSSSKECKSLSERGKEQSGSLHTSFNHLLPGKGFHTVK